MTPPDIADLNLPERAIPLLAGVVGSTAYGLNTPGSDIDYAAVYAWPTRDLVGMATPASPDTPIPESVHVPKTHNLYLTPGDQRRGDANRPPGDRPDLTAHEARKFLTLVLNGNPSVTEMLWLPDYLHCNAHARALIGIREHLSAGPMIRRTYLGYATGQFKRLHERGDGSFSADTRKRTAKHARHLLRLCRQGFDFYTTGVLTVRVENPEEYHEFGEQVAGGELEVAQAMLAFYDAAFGARPSALPEQPDRDLAAAWLAALREHYW